MSEEPRKLRNWQIKMIKEDLFTNLPTEVVIDILSRLPIRSIITCKIVCKSWRKVIGSLEFANSHLSKAAPRLFVFLGEIRTIRYRMVAFVDEHRSPHRCQIVSSLSLPHPGVILGSANGLLFWCNGDQNSRDILVCNPITREYIKLPPPPPPPPPQFEICHNVTAGVGVSKMSGQYKIVRILQDDKLHHCECQVHTVGSGSWRSFSTDTQRTYSTRSVGAFLNGNLHWSVSGSRRISCFDLESEVFTSFSSPRGLRSESYRTVSVVGDCLCLCENDVSTDIWLMKEYGIKKSWAKEFVISVGPSPDPDVLYGRLFPIKVFQNGDILIARVGTGQGNILLLEDDWCYS